MQERSRIWLEFGLCTVIFGLVPIAIKLVDANPTSIGVIRLLGGIVCFLSVPKTLTLAKSIKRSDLTSLSLLGIAFFLHWFLYFHSIKLSSPTIAVLGLSTYGVHLMILSILFQGRRPSITDGIALILSLTGVYLVAPTLNLSNDTSLGLFIGILSGFFFSVLPIIHQRNRHLADSVRSFYMFLGALALFLLSSINSTWTASLDDWHLFLFLIIGGTFISHNLWTKVSTYFPSNLTAVLYYSYIPLTILFSWLLLNETPEANKIWGGALICGGGLLAVSRFQTSTKNKKSSLREKVH